MIPTRIGQKLQGGTFTGFNRIRNSVYGIIVAPKITDDELELKLFDTTTSNTSSVIDGVTNTNAMNNTKHPAARYFKNLVVNGFKDWYIPSKNELELCYRYLKPNSSYNQDYVKNTYGGNLSLPNGTNLSSIPQGEPYTKTSPTQTIVTRYRYSYGEKFIGRYWTSTESSTNPEGSLIQGFLNGYQCWFNKTDVNKVKGVRRVLVAQKQEQY